MPDGTTIVFGALALVSVVGAVGMLWTSNVVRAAYWLLLISVTTAGLFALAQAGYVAIMQLLIYAGAIAILNIFTIMITMRRREDAVRSRDFSLPGLLLAFTFFAVVAIAILGGPSIETVQVDRFPGITEFGEQLFAPDGWALPFEIASLLLLAALIGAVWWSKEGDEQ
jgi:NADH-quinone oxidoreductase subunit J